MAHAINWFEIPATDLERAKKFYSEVMQIEMEVQDMMGIKMAIFPMDEGDICGALCQGEMFTPSQTGTVVYLNCGDDLTPHISRVEAAGGKVVVPKTLITEEIGYFAVFTDTEGNNVAMHSIG